MVQKPIPMQMLGGTGLSNLSAFTKANYVNPIPMNTQGDQALMSSLKDYSMQDVMSERRKSGDLLAGHGRPQT